MTPNGRELTEAQQKALDMVVRYLALLMKIGHPCRITLHTDGQGGLAYDNVEVQAHVNLRKFPFSFVPENRPS